jgi:hypothetical protein
MEEKLIKKLMTAILAKELQFNEGVRESFVVENDGNVKHRIEYFVNNTMYDYSDDKKTLYGKPTLDQLKEWIKNKFNIEVSVKGDNEYFFMIDTNKSISFSTHSFSTHEDALEEGLIAAMNIIKKRKRNHLDSFLY